MYAFNFKSQFQILIQRACRDRYPFFITFFTDGIGFSMEKQFNRNLKHERPTKSISLMWAPKFPSLNLRSLRTFQLKFHLHHSVFILLMLLSVMNIFSQPSIPKFQSFQPISLQQQYSKQSHCLRRKTQFSETIQQMKGISSL
jgi:hypothetical protein